MRRPGLVVGVGGASGAIYAQRLVAWLWTHREQHGRDVHLVFTRTGRLVWRHEVGVPLSDLGFPVHNHGDMTAPFASGSAKFGAMVIVPCSAGCLGRVAHGLSTDLVGRAADVMLKERRKLVMVLRESPYSLVHLQNMARVTEAGAVVLPASPSFYGRPASLDDAVDTVVARVLDHLGLDNAVSPRWAGMPQDAETR